ncbi:hypothetical protein K456DRAFT_979856 [Colletotrichum gloeosporioides 23]|nr:hypothetical protein K456DRAFT_979856 [Colletotrichum gloeosporioides 23]
MRKCLKPNSNTLPPLTWPVSAVRNCCWLHIPRQTGYPSKPSLINFVGQGIREFLIFFSALAWCLVRKGPVDVRLSWGSAAAHLQRCDNDVSRKRKHAIRCPHRASYDEAPKGRQISETLVRSTIHRGTRLILPLLSNDDQTDWTPPGEKYCGNTRTRAHTIRLASRTMSSFSLAMVESHSRSAW